MVATFGIQGDAVPGLRSKVPRMGACGDHHAAGMEVQTGTLDHHPIRPTLQPFGPRADVPLTERHQEGARAHPAAEEADMSRVLVDSNVLIDLFTRDPEWLPWSLARMRELLETSVLVINPIIYAEVSISFPDIARLEHVFATPTPAQERNP